MQLNGGRRPFAFVYAHSGLDCHLHIHVDDERGMLYLLACRGEHSDPRTDVMADMVARDPIPEEFSAEPATMADYLISRFFSDRRAAKYEPSQADRLRLREKLRDWLLAS